MSKKVLVIGLDGATFDLITPWVNAGMLPTFSRIMKEGAYGELKSTIHPMSAIAWASFMTGMNPGKHGIFDVTEQLANSYEIRFTSGASGVGRTLWGILSEVGKTVGVINVPMTYPPERVNGYLISGMDSPGLDSNATYPEGLYKEIREKFGRYCIEYGNPMQNKSLDEFVAAVHDAIEQRNNVFNYLRRTYPTDFSIAVFVATDRVQHFFWKYMPGGLPSSEKTTSKYTNVIANVYQRLDAIIGELIEDLDDDTLLFLMSDHGAGPLCKLVNINAWLRMRGLLKLNDEEGGFGNPLSRLKNTPYFLARLGRSLLRQYLPDHWKAWIKSLFPGTKDRLMTYLFLSKIDWSRTKAYSIGYFGDVRINVLGREPQGIVNPGTEYEDLRDEIIRKLEALEDPDTGEKVIEKVYRREELYHGDQASKAADLIIQWQGYRYKSRINLELDERVSSSHIMIEPSKYSKTSSIHNLNGIFMALGRDIKYGIKLKDAEIIDLAPTILYAMGEHIPDCIDGRVLKEIFEGSFLDRNEVKRCTMEEGIPRSQRVYTEAEAERIKDRLQGLGYID